MKKSLSITLAALIFITYSLKAQVPHDTLIVIDSIKPVFSFDTTLRIKNFSPYFTLHVDSTLDYRFEINKDPKQYYYFLNQEQILQ